MTEVMSETAGAIPFALPEHAPRALPPFCDLRRFGPAGADREAPPVLLVAPMSGHDAALLRDMVATLAQALRVSVLAWRDPRRVPKEAGRFDLARSARCVADAIRLSGPVPVVVGVCQSVTTVLSAASALAPGDGDAAPRGLILIGGPVDVRANLTGTAAVIRSWPLSAYAAMMTTVPPPWPGAGRAVFPAALRHAAFVQYAARHGLASDRFATRLWRERAQPDGAPGLADLFFTARDLPAEWMLESLARVYGLADGAEPPAPWFDGLNLDALGEVAMLTVEGSADDVAAPGQTHAAHALFGARGTVRREAVTIPGAGHFDLFGGPAWRETVAPVVLRFIDRLAAVQQAPAPA